MGRSRSGTLAELPGEPTAEAGREPPTLAFACSSWPLSSLTRPSRVLSLSMTCVEATESVPRPCGALGPPACVEAVGAVGSAWLARRSRRRAHLGGRSVDGYTQGMLALRQFEQGDDLSHRTLRRRQTTQLRGFCGAETGAARGDGMAACADDDAAEVGVLACFSEAEAETRPKPSGLPPVDDMLGTHAQHTHMRDEAPYSQSMGAHSVASGSLGLVVFQP